MNYEFKLMPPRIFPATAEMPAPEQAAAFLTEATVDGWEPVQLVATGLPARIVLSGALDERAFIILRRTVAPKAKATK